MKKALKIIGIIILCIIVIPLIIALFISKDFNFETNIAVDAPIENVWMFTSSLEGMNKWSPWNDMDPNMFKENGGIDGEVGAWESWQSEVKDVGHGKQTIVNIEAPYLMETYLEFYVPYESEAEAYVSLAKDGEQTMVIWGFKSTMPYPMNIMKLFFKDAEMMDPMEKGLNKLKKLSEAVVLETDEEIEE